MPLLAFLFFFSGLTALVYQVLWLRLLALIFGVTVQAASTVLASYMAGLALGSVVGGRVADRVRHPLAVFGAVEMLIGGSALLSPRALDLVTDLYVTVHPVVGDAAPLLTLTRFLLTFVVLLVPTALMGATLPLVVRSSLIGSARLGSCVSLLYATNTAGAIAGVGAAAFYLVPSVGVSGAFGMAALLNVLVGGSAIAMSRFLGSGVPRFRNLGTPEPRNLGTPDSTRRLVLFVFGVSGFTSLALEVIWFRVLVIFMGPTAYAFAIMLATVLAGIALGSALVTPWMRRQIDCVALLAILQIAVSVAALTSFRALAFIRPAAGYVDEAWAQMTVGVHYLSTVLVGSVFAILPTAVLFGLAFPIGVRVWVGIGEERGQAAARVGVFYAVNLCGAVLGPLAAGFWLLPRAGSRGSLIAIAGMTLASAFVLLSVLAPRRPRFAAVAALGGALAFGAAATNLDQALVAALVRAYGSEERLWWDEGVQTTVMVNRRPAGPTGPGMRILYLDGWHQANDSPGTLFMERTIGVLPMLLHPEPSRALVIGLGGGATAGAIARLPGVQVDIVELSPSVARAADEWFSHSNFGLLRRPNVSLRVDDGRNYLLLTDQRFDVITADIIIPRHVGSANLYSAEYFQLARRALTRSGMMLQWLGGDTDVENRTIMGTFLSVFPHATLWAGRSLLIGTVDPLLIRRDQVERRLADPATGAALEVAGITNFEMLRLLYDAGPEELRVYVGDGPILTDDRPFMEYFLSRVDKRDADMSGLTGDMMRHVR